MHCGALLCLPTFYCSGLRLLPWGPECRVEILRAEFYTDMRPGCHVSLEKSGATSPMGLE